MTEQHIYRISDELNNQEQFYVFNVVRENDKITLCDLKLLIMDNNTESRVILNITEILNQIKTKPNVSIANKKQKQIINEVFDDLSKSVSGRDINLNELTYTHELVDELDNIDLYKLLECQTDLDSMAHTKYNDIVNNLNDNKR